MIVNEFDDLVRVRTLIAIQLTKENSFSLIHSLESD